MKNVSKPLEFPKDNLAHNNIIEWWYFNGHLKDRFNNYYFFMTCLFKADNKRVNIPFLSKLPFKTIYFSHTILTDGKRKKFYSEINPVVIVSQDSFKRKFLYVNYILPSLNGYVNNVIEEIPAENFPQFHIKTKFFDLTLNSTKKPVLVGGNGFVKLGAKSTYYCSYSNLETLGILTLEGRELEVSGISWLDHQWADVPYSKDLWNWFCVQLANKMELVCFEYHDRRKNKSFFLATVIFPSGEQKSFSEVEIIPKNVYWESKKTGAKYPLEWRINIPSIKLILETKPVAKNQEVVFGEINYWEGAINVTGNYGNKKVKGKGFMELVGYEIQKSKVQIYQAIIKEKVKSLLPRIKRFFSTGMLK